MQESSKLSDSVWQRFVISRYFNNFCNSQGLPITAYYKLIDWWLFALFNILALTFIFHTYLAYVVSNGEKGSQNGVTNGSIMKQAKFLNTFANLTFIILLVLFNLVFWIVALSEHFRPSEYYLSRH